MWSASTGPHNARRPGRYDETALTKAIIRLAEQYGRYGYRRITACQR